MNRSAPLICLLLFVSSALLSQNSDKKALKRFRKAKRTEFLKKDQSPLDKRTVRGLRYFPYAATFQIPARITRLKNGPIVPFATSSGQRRDYTAYAYLDFEREGETHRLTVYQLTNAGRLPEAYRDHLFLPFNDKTNGDKTYGGGRYIDLRLADLEGDTLLLDFNRAYNPYCAYTDGYSCPVPPVNNRLELAIEAGECNFAATFKSRTNP